MEDDRISLHEKFITEFCLNTCQKRRRVSQQCIYAWRRCAEIAMQVDCINVETDFVPIVTGSVAEIYIEPMFSCVGDADIMFHASCELAIPEGYTPPTQLPSEFDSSVRVYEIVDSEFPGYVNLWLSYLLSECVDDGKYNAVPCVRRIAIHTRPNHLCSMHGPAHVHKYAVTGILSLDPDSGIRFSNSVLSVDNVMCIRCLTWPPQAAEWPIRQKNYGWPDSATVDFVVHKGCDVVHVAHRQCKHDEWMNKCQSRMSFSRAEIVLLNSWLPVQQIVYHMLRVFMKTERLTGSANDSGSGTLSNYHIKTLMLWACELKPRSWWTDDFNIIRICVDLLHILAIWLTGAHCQHYFINNCNLLDRNENSRYTQDTANRLMSITRQWFCEWCFNSYLRKCVASVRFCHASCLQNTLSKIVKWRQNILLKLDAWYLHKAQSHVMEHVVRHSLTLRSCLCWINQLEKSDQILHLYFIAIVFLHVAYKTVRGSLTDEMLDILATTCLQSNDVRRCLNARHSGELSLSQAAMLMKVVANNSRSTVQLIEIELAKAYLYKALRCEDSDRNSIYCLANVYLGVLYYITGEYQTAIDHYVLTMRNLQHHCHCSSHVVQGQLLPRIDDEIDNMLGMAVFYQYIRAAALNEEQERRHVSVFTTELFAHYMYIKLLSVTECHRLPQTSLADETQRYRNCLRNSPKMFVTDAIVFSFINRRNYPSNDGHVRADSGETKSLIVYQLHTSKLVQLLQQSAVEHLATCRDLEARDVDSFSIDRVVTADLKALYAYKCGQYQRCLQLSVHNVKCMLTDYSCYSMSGPLFFTCPELFQLIDDELASLIGLAVLVSRQSLACTELSLSLYLMTRCQIKLHNAVTSLARTWDYVHLARFKMKQRGGFVGYDRFVLKFVQQMILKYVAADHY